MIGGCPLAALAEEQPLAVNALTVSNVSLAACYEYQLSGELKVKVME